MKKYTLIALSLILTLTFSACGRNSNQADSNMTILPDPMPTLETNIPDPDVDTKMPIYTEGTETNTMDPTEQSNGIARNGY